MIVYTFPALKEEIVKERPNRFTVITVSGRKCHLHDPGRLKELIYPGNRILIREVKGNRKTDCQVTAAWSGKEWVVTDSSIHSEIARKFLPTDAESEVRVGESRLDFVFDDTFVEVKGCTLVKDGVALFPDAPTERGRRHIEELIKLKREGHNAVILILVMRSDATCFSPNFETDKKFSETFLRALKEGVKVEVKTFYFDDKSLVYKGDIPICRDLLH
ncbi:DNA/RNA nuclease SfsA [Stygiolobus azoricus]|uniref:Sugar fermentation stimulation protein homolog n=1 Tax=Stygiolobus azoricus TaxID=41675 RepID=A0A650CQ52_9CREN|nr:DNA/RNA nuclease SfsA [Stygiolobus azoricus]QGR19845.1 DNA/RNA nuclease SfsA [Stygiolobus azoricus]